MNLRPNPPTSHGLSQPVLHIRDYACKASNLSSSQSTGGGALDKVALEDKEYYHHGHGVEHGAGQNKVG
ncbi:MAG: hypothetical protein JWO59_2884, partial [Chloroflexi bacterium]|nr:hypothetical protein [Chloroflexota bacterium]